MTGLWYRYIIIKNYFHKCKYIDEDGVMRVLLFRERVELLKPSPKSLITSRLGVILLKCFVNAY